MTSGSDSACKRACGGRWRRIFPFGASISTPTWFQTYHWTVQTGSGADETINFQMNRPLTAQVGANYAVAENTHILADVGYIAYGSTKGFEDSGFQANGSIVGLGWQDSWTFELGIQQALSSSVVVRAGYNYCTDPIPDDMTFYNVGSPLHVVQHLSVGPIHCRVEQCDPRRLVHPRVLQHTVQHMVQSVPRRARHKHHFRDVGQRVCRGDV